MERRFGVHEPNITPWRRAVTGDLTSAFDFKTPNRTAMRLPATVAYRPPDNQRHPDYVPAPPVEQRMPVQERGTRPARALPYEYAVDARVDPGKREVELSFHNSGGAGAVFHVRSGDRSRGPWSYTVGAHAELKDTLSGRRWTSTSFPCMARMVSIVYIEGRFAGVDVAVTAKHVNDRGRGRRTASEHHADRCAMRARRCAR